MIGSLQKLCAWGVLLTPFVVTGHAAGRESAPRIIPTVPKVEPLALESYDLVSLRRIQFPAGHRNLIRGERVVIDQIAQTLSKRPGSIIELRGYADDAASASANFSLSVERANVIARRLIANGVARERIVILGLGEVDPNGPARLAEHQRVDVRVFTRPTTVTRMRHESAAGSLIQETWGGKVEP